MSRILAVDVRIIPRLMAGEKVSWPRTVSLKMWDKH